MNITLIIYNRPDTTERVFNAIRQAKPDKLFVVADSPDKDDVKNAERCALVRQIVEKIDWNCQVYRNYADEHMGLDERISSGLSWVFEHVPDSIVLEDDCYPHPSFFPYCSELLDRYRDDERIMCVSGNSFQQDAGHGEFSYYFSRYFHCWGWASWARAWRHFDLSLSGWPEFRDGGGLESWFPNPEERRYWTDIMDMKYEQPGIKWDFGFLFACWAQSGLTVLPWVNLISNIGFSPQGSQAVSAYSGLANMPVRDIGEISHPPFVFRDERADRYEYEYRHTLPSLATRIKANLEQLFSRQSEDP